MFIYPLIHSTNVWWISARGQVLFPGGIALNKTKSQDLKSLPFGEWMRERQTMNK